MGKRGKSGLTGLRRIKIVIILRKEPVLVRDRNDGEVAEDLFELGLCLPSGTAMTEQDLERIVDTILNSRPG